MSTTETQQEAFTPEEWRALQLAVFRATLPVAAADGAVEESELSAISRAADDLAGSEEASPLVRRLMGSLAALDSQALIAEAAMEGVGWEQGLEEAQRILDDRAPPDEARAVKQTLVRLALLVSGVSVAVGDKALRVAGVQEALGLGGHEAPPVPAIPPPPPARAPDTKPCPSCGKEIKTRALVCRFCGVELEAQTRTPGTPPPEAPPPPPPAVASPLPVPGRPRGRRRWIRLSVAALVIAAAAAAFIAVIVGKTSQSELRARYAGLYRAPNGNEVALYSSGSWARRPASRYAGSASSVGLARGSGSPHAFDWYVAKGKRIWLPTKVVNGKVSEGYGFVVHRETARGRTLAPIHKVGGTWRLSLPLYGLVGGRPSGGGSSPERGFLALAVGKLDGARPAEKRCEALFGRLSRDLSGGTISTATALGPRQTQVRACFAAVKKQTLAARSSLRQMLNVNGVSETKKYSAKALGRMPAGVGYAWLLADPITKFNKEIDNAVHLVNEAQLGAPLGAGLLWGVPGVKQEPTQAIVTLLWLGKWRTYLASTVKTARRNALD